MKPLSVKCRSCHGKGKTHLSAPLVETLLTIGKKGATASEVYDRLNEPKLDRSAVNQRLKKLVSLGFLKSKKVHRELRIYLPV